MKKTINKSESLLLMGSMRIAICEAIDNLNVKSKKAMKSFVLKEATDYDIMYFALTESFPRGKATTKEVKFLFEAFSQVCLENYSTVVGMVGKKDTMVLINEVSAFDAIRKGTYLSEKGIGTDFGSAVEHQKNAAMLAQNGFTGGTGKVASGQDMATNRLQADMAGATGHDKSKLAMGVNRVYSKGVHAYDDVMKSLHGVADKLGATGVGQKLAKAMGTSEGHAGTTLGVGGIVAAGLLIYGAIKTYKRFFSQAAKACAGKSGAEKTACMDRAKGGALMAQKKDLSSASAACAKTKDPAKCKAVIANRLKKIQAKASKK